MWLIAASRLETGPDPASIEPPMRFYDARNVKGIERYSTSSRGETTITDVLGMSS